ncbi:MULTISPECIES: glycosyl hydrolase family 28-related protein [Myxococcaceae]|uniref:glycosyl hydrolase family 28-related protein n=1 Tax=Myxococcaceae TaxID=31 RepID=UPI00188F2984|nr:MULTISPECIES: glycosyl hydrolase family 28-related protein [Myxococcaceae]MBF5041996.1 right-handed parallel beta-helix repeat-containing protein [Simulacricoccus sp. 17bor-14]
MNRRLFLTLPALLACGGGSPSPGSPPPPTGQPFDVTAFGARGDGVTDDTAAIQAALDAAGAAGGGMVLVPSGTFRVSPSARTRLVLRSGVHLTGQGLSSVLKVRDDAGDYGTLLGAATDATPLTDVRISNLWIDQNTEANRTGSVRTGQESAVQNALRVFAGSDVHVEGVRFDGAGVNTVRLNGVDLTRVSVRSCEFRFRPKDGVADYDNSAVYFDCTHHEAQGNTFSAAIGSGARACIETHRGPSLVTGNHSDGYWTGVNAVSASGSAPEVPSGNDLQVTGNTFSRCNWGIQLWSITGRVLSNVVVSDNVLSVAQVSHGQGSCAGISFVYRASGALEGRLRGIVVRGNTVTHEDEPADGRPMADAFLTAGLSLLPAGDVEDVVVMGNLISRAPVAGLRMANALTGARAVNVRVAQNLFVDFGQNVGVPPSYRAAFYLASRLEDVVIEGNTLRDTFPVRRGLYSVYFDASPGNAAVRSHYRDNHETTADGSAFLFHSDQDLKTAGAPALPTRGTWSRGDRVLNSLPAPGAPRGWVCVESGSPGVWVVDGVL